MARSRPFLLLSLGLVAITASPISAQRNIMLTGKPQASLSEPFSKLGGVREISGSKAIILDSQDDRLVYADFSAGTVRDIGRKGGGPGEYQRPMSLLAGPGTATWVPDPLLSKVHVIDANGKIAANGLVPPSADGAPIALLPRAVDRMGRMYIQSTPRLGNDGRISDSVSVLRWNPNGNTIDTLAKVPSGMKISASSSGNSRTMMIRSKPFNADDVWTVLPDGRLVLVHAVPYRVDIIDGKQVHSGAAVPYTPIKVTSADRDAYRKQESSGRPIVRTFGNGGGSAPPPSASRIQATPDEDFPPTKPPFAGTSSVRVSPEGEIWVLRSRAFADQVPTYDIFDGNGRLTAKATLNPNSVVIGFGDGTVYVARTDPDDDLAYVERFARPKSGDTGASRLGGE